MRGAHRHDMLFVGEDARPRLVGRPWAPRLLRYCRPQRSEDERTWPIGLPCEAFLRLQLGNVGRFARAAPDSWVVRRRPRNVRRSSTHKSTSLELAKGPHHRTPRQRSCGLRQQIGAAVDRGS